MEMRLKWTTISIQLFLLCNAATYLLGGWSDTNDTILVKYDLNFQFDLMIIII